MPATGYGPNLMRNGTPVTIAQASQPWYSYFEDKVDDAVLSGSGNHYGNTYSFGSNWNDGRGIEVTFEDSYALQAIKLYGHKGVADAGIFYHDGLEWVQISTVYLTNANADPDGGVVGTFNPSGAITSKRWKWEIVNYDNYAGNANFYAYEVEWYSHELNFVTGTIDENLPIDEFEAVVYDYETKLFKQSVDVDTASDPSFSLSFALNHPVLLTVTPKAKIWTPNAVLVAGDVVYPTDPATTSFYYIVSVGGTTGVSEPTWPTQAGTVVDNAVTFTWAGGMIAPITHGPLIPQLVV